MAVTLTGSVGRKGKNTPEDVKSVQELLNAFAKLLKLSKLKTDGKPSKALETAIGKFQEQVCKFRPDFKVDPKKTTLKKLNAGPAKAAAEQKAEEKKHEKAKEDQHKKTMASVKKLAEKAAKKQGVDSKSWKSLYSDLEKYATEQWFAYMGKEEKKGPADQKCLVKNADKVLKDALANFDYLLGGQESQPDAKVPLTLKGSVTTIKGGCFDFKVSGMSPDPKAKILLVPDKFSLTLDITKGWDKKSMVGLFKLLDQGKLWGKNVSFYAVETTDGKPDMKTCSKAVVLATPVAPFKGTVSLEGIGKDTGMTYTGNGKGRYLYTAPINGWYFLKYGPNFERDPKMRGFDCITYVGSAMKTMSGMGGRGDGLAAHLGASKVDMEDVTKDKVVEFFGKDGKSGTYIAWWSTHCIAVKNGTVYEFSQSKKGFNKKAAGSYGWPSKGNYVRKL
ncbi:hypothetical protein RA19_20280 [Leisingera sp. ANG-M1]|uniref:hypothetical protein n=1 Tax=Leisingera sp. ANG-M1 TaxID=1577895 RepID=UPI00057DE088|nr:hypothetical protein [Leisingera sp. ANG-M1]KIC08314.1 hypothetical protein RA19_20280 [Leisingera sp. ANG-M1]